MNGPLATGTPPLVCSLGTSASWCLLQILHDGAVSGVRQRTQMGSALARYIDASSAPLQQVGQGTAAVAQWRSTIFEDAQLRRFFLLT